jgi:hypothetical protein
VPILAIISIRWGTVIDIVFTKTKEVGPQSTKKGRALSPPYELWGVSDLGGGSPPGIFLPPPPGEF